MRSAPVTLPALAGGGEGLNWGRSLSGAARGGSGFSFLALQEKRMARLHPERLPGS